MTEIMIFLESFSKQNTSYMRAELFNLLVKLSTPWQNTQRNNLQEECICLFLQMFVGLCFMVKVRQKIMVAVVWT